MNYEEKNKYKDQLPIAEADIRIYKSCPPSDIYQSTESGDISQNSATDNFLIVHHLQGQNFLNPEAATCAS